MAPKHLLLQQCIYKCFETGCTENMRCFCLDFAIVLRKIKPFSEAISQLQLSAIPRYRQLKSKLIVAGALLELSGNKSVGVFV